MTNADPTIETVAWKMLESGLPPAFVLRIRELAARNEGVKDIALIWWDCEDSADRDAAVIALSEAIEDHEAPGPRVVVRSEEDVDRLIEARMAWKEHLRALVEARGGVSRIARESGIPQPSLSRILNSPSAPRPATLQRLANALGLPVEALHPSTEEAESVVVHLADYRPAAPEPSGPLLTYRTAHG